jgi:hypothetical protein
MSHEAKKATWGMGRKMRLQIAFAVVRSETVVCFRIGG